MLQRELGKCDADFMKTYKVRMRVHIISCDVLRVLFNQACACASWASDLLWHYLAQVAVLELCTAKTCASMLARRDTGQTHLVLYESCSLGPHGCHNRNRLHRQTVSLNEAA